MQAHQCFFLRRKPYLDVTSSKNSSKIDVTPSKTSSTITIPPRYRTSPFWVCVWQKAFRPPHQMRQGHNVYRNPIAEHVSPPEFRRGHCEGDTCFGLPKEDTCYGHVFLGTSCSGHVFLAVVGLPEIIGYPPPPRVTLLYSLYWYCYSDLCNPPLSADYLRYKSIFFLAKIWPNPVWSVQTVTVWRCGTSGW
jgi:hypothetical protein